MRKKAIVSLFASCAILLAGCGGGNDTPAPAPAPAPSPALATATTQTPAAAPAGNIYGVWDYPDSEVRLQLFEDQTWEMLDSESGELLAGGTITMNGDTAELYYTYNSPWDDGAMYTELKYSKAGELSDAIGNPLYLTGDAPVSHGVVQSGASGAQTGAENGDIGPFVGLWEYMGADLWLQIYGDGTFDVFDGLGHAIYNGTVTMAGSTAVLDNEWHNFQQELTLNTDGSLSGREPGDLFVSVESLPESYYGLGDFAGYWAYEESKLWLAVYEDGTWELVNTAGDAILDGACGVEKNRLVLYDDTGAYYMAFEISPTDCMFSDELDEVLWPCLDLPGR